MTWEEISNELFGKRTAKRFKLRLSKLGNGMITDTQKREDLYFDKEFLDATLPKATEWLNALNDENEELKQSIHRLKQNIDELSVNVEEELLKENEQLQKSLLASVEKNRKLQTILDKLGYTYVGDLK